MRFVREKSSGGREEMELLLRLSWCRLLSWPIEGDRDLIWLPFKFRRTKFLRDAARCTTLVIVLAHSLEMLL